MLQCGRLEQRPQRRGPTCGAFSFSVLASTTQTGWPSGKPALYALYLPGFAAALRAPRSTLRIRAAHRFGSRASLHSQILRTRHPRRLRTRETLRSRTLFRSIFAAQNRAFRAGVRFRPQPRCPCQKQPSTNSATPSRGQMKSGFPSTAAFRRQPASLSARSSLAMRSSVVRFPAPRMRDMSSERVSPPKGVRTAS